MHPKLLIMGHGWTLLLIGWPPQSNGCSLLALKCHFYANSAFMSFTVNIFRDAASLFWAVCEQRILQTTKRVSKFNLPSDCSIEYEAFLLL